MLKKIDTLFIELTKSCNLKCKQCGYWKLKEKDCITSKQFEKIVDYFEKFGVKVVHLTGGEPLLAEEILDILKIAKNKNLFIKISTNGTLINKIMRGENLALIDEITISLDSSNAKTYEHIRGRNAFDEIVKGIQFMMNQKNRPQIALSFLIQRANYKEVTEFVEFAVKCNVDRIAFLVPNRNGDFTNTLNQELYNKNVFLNYEEAQEWNKSIYPSLMKVMNKHQSHLIMPNSHHMQALRGYFDFSASQLRQSICMQPLNSMFITSDMKFKLCPYFDETYTLNNFNIENKLEEERLKIFFDTQIKERKCA